MGDIRISKDESEKGWAFDLKRVQVELYHLLCLFLADEAYASILIDEKDPLWDIAFFAEPEITRILVNSAVIGRIIDDREGRFLPKSNCYCGGLTINQKSTKLNLREAFNKIIHAEAFDLEIDNKKRGFSHFKPRIYLHGILGSETWEAQLDIVAYVREYCRHINELEKDNTFS